MKTTAMIAILVAAMFLMGPAVALDIDVGQNEAEAATFSEEYVAGPAGDVAWLLGTSNLGLGVYDCDPLIAQLCFDVETSADTADITFNDDSNLDVSALVVWVGAGASGVQCGNASDVDIPEGATHLHVYMNGPVFAAADCTMTTATTGSVSVIWD